MMEKDIVITVEDQTKMRAYYAHPDDGKKHPAIIVVHEIWGLDSSIRAIAKRYAEKGYVVLSPDLYHRDAQVLNPKNIEKAMMKFFSVPPEKRNDPETMKNFMDSADPDEKAVVQKIFMARESLELSMVNDLVSCKLYLDKDPNVKPGAIGATGFCLGGGLVFQLATKTDIGATVVFYGANPKPIDAVSKIKGAVMGLYAGEDLGVNRGLSELVGQFVKLKKGFTMKIYPGAVHAFFNHERPTYNKAVADDAWKMATGFFTEHLGE